MASSERERLSVCLEPMQQEPWVRLGDGASLAAWDHEDEIAYNQANRQTEKALFFRRAFDFLTSNQVHGDYHEFGCHRCRTFRMALSEARRHNIENMKFFAFDSFEGLPNVDVAAGTSVDAWKRGALSTSESSFMELVRDHAVYVDQVRTIKGFYDQSLTRQLQQKFIAEEGSISLVNIDCDLYESAVPVFEFIDPLLQEGAVIYIDDMFAGFKGHPNKGVARAFREYRGKSRWQFTRHLDVGWWGRSYIVYVDADIRQST
jgi:hypothetical protein